MYFRCHGVRYRITREREIDTVIWVLERAGRMSLGSGQHAGRHCWPAPYTPAGLTSLIVAATVPW
jgi:hypothetical protein